MRHCEIKTLLLVSVAAFAGMTLADDPVPEDGPGWTGLSHPQQIIAARQAVMLEIERMMRPLDSYTAGETLDPVELRAAAGTIESMLLAVPHLFPPTTNLYDADDAAPATLALPAIWQDFAVFYELSAASASAASSVAASPDDQALRAAAGRLRASCDACHAVYLRPYVAAEVSSEDLEFDFDSVLPPN